MKRIPVLLALILLLAVTFSTLTVSQETGVGATATPDHLTLTWTKNPAETITITWRTDTTVSSGVVDYQKGAVLATSAKRAQAKLSSFMTDLGPSRLFTATLTGLSPNTKYSYRVGDGTHWSEIHTFTTADPKARNFKFLIFGDSQSSATGSAPYALWGKTVHNAYTANPDARFITNVGDMVNTGQSCAHWNAWFAAAAGVIDTIPEMPVTGNHETNGLSSTKRPVYWNAQFHLPQNGPVGLKNQVYSYDYGSVHFVVLDSQENEGKQYGDILARQEDWLDRDLAASKATWKIVFYHRPAYSVKGDRDNKRVREAFCPAMERRHTDLVFNGHDHGVGRTYPIKGGVYMRKPSQGTIHYITGRSGSKHYPNLSKKAWNTFFYNPEDQPNYLVVEVADTKLIVKTVKLDGTLVDTFFIDKKKDISSDSFKDISNPPMKPMN